MTLTSTSSTSLIIATYAVLLQTGNHSWIVWQTKQGFVNPVVFSSFHFTLTSEPILVQRRRELFVPTNASSQVCFVSLLLDTKDRICDAPHTISLFLREIPPVDDLKSCQGEIFFKKKNRGNRRREKGRENRVLDSLPEKHKSS